MGLPRYSAMLNVPTFNIAFELRSEAPQAPMLTKLHHSPYAPGAIRTHDFHLSSQANCFGLESSISK